MSYDSRPDTYEHIAKVRGLLLGLATNLVTRAHVHDQSKLEEPELSVFNEYTPKLRDSTYGSPEYEEYRKGMGAGLEHHYAHNRHHPEHFCGGDPVALYSAGHPDSRWARGKREIQQHGIHAMNLLDLIEMLADWKAATERHADGDLDRSITLNRERFGYGGEIEALLRNTAIDCGWLEANTFAEEEKAA